MPWLLADQIADAISIGDLLKIGGSVGATATIMLLAKGVYELWRRHKDAAKQDAKDELSLDIQRGEAKLALDIKEEEQIEGQLQRVISQQDKLITKGQIQNEKLRDTVNELTGKLSAATTRIEFIQNQREEDKKYISELRAERDTARKKYYALKTGTKPDSDVQPPGTEIAPEKP